MLERGNIRSRRYRSLFAAILPTVTSCIGATSMTSTHPFRPMCGTTRNVSTTGDRQRDLPSVGDRLQHRGERGRISIAASL
jgi:hypothetical protein